MLVFITYCGCFKISLIVLKEYILKLYLKEDKPEVYLIIYYTYRPSILTFHIPFYMHINTEDGYVKFLYYFVMY